MTVYHVSKDWWADKQNSVHLLCSILIQACNESSNIKINTGQLSLIRLQLFHVDKYAVMRWKVLTDLLYCDILYSIDSVCLLLTYPTKQISHSGVYLIVYLILPSNDNLHFFIGSSTSMHSPPAEYDISLSPVKLVSGSDGSSSNPISGIYQWRNIHVDPTQQSAMLFNVSVHHASQFSAQHQTDSSDRNKAEPVQNKICKSSLNQIMDHQLLHIALSNIFHYKPESVSVIAVCSLYCATWIHYCQHNLFSTE